MAQPIVIRGEVIGPGWSQYLGGEVEEAARAVTAGVRAATEGLHLQMRQQLLAAGVKPVVANMIGRAVYPKTGHSLGAAGSIFGKGPQAQLLLDAFSQARVITPGKGKYLAIPTGYNLEGGRRTAAGSAVRLKVTAQQMFAAKKMTFVRPVRGGISQYSGGKVWFLRVQVALEQGRNGVRRLAYAGGFRNALVGGGRQRRTDFITGFAKDANPDGAVPMFLLLPLVAIAQKFDPEALAQIWTDQVPDLIGRGFKD